MTEQEPKHKKPSFEPLVPLGLFLVIFGAIITSVPVMPESWLGQGGREIGEMDKIVNFVSGLAFLLWGGAWFYVGWKRTKKMREAESQQKDEKL
jgi:hypothetical protein